MIQHWWRWWRSAEQRQAIIWTNNDIVYCRIYASLDTNELVNTSTENCILKVGVKWMLYQHIWTTPINVWPSSSKNASFCPPVRPSVCLSHLFSLCSCHRIIMKFSGVNTIDKSDVHGRGQGQRSKVKVTEVKTQFSRFRTVTPVWIHIWLQNDTQTWSSIA